MTKVNSTFTTHTYGTVSSHYNETRNMTTYSMRRRHFTNWNFHAVSQTSVRETRISRLKITHQLHIRRNEFLGNFLCREDIWKFSYVTHTNTKHP